MKRLATGILGWFVLIIGIIAIPYPGPGWLIVFAGLSILAKQYPWANRVLIFTKGKYDAWGKWLKRQGIAIKALFWVLTFAVVIITLWLLNGYGAISDFLHLGWDWARSPLSIFSK